MVIFSGTLASKIKKFIWKNRKIFLFSSFELVISGFFMAMFLIIAFFLKTTVPKRFNLAFELPFYVLIGIILNWFKGIIVAFSFDFGKLLLTSRIVFWTPEYGIVPILVVIISSISFHLATKKDIFLVFLLVLTFVIAIFVFFYYFFTKENEIEKVPKDWKSIFSKKLILILIALFGIVLTSFATILLILYWKNRIQKIKIALISLFVLSFCFLIFRWIWHPYAFIQYYNRFLNRSGNDRLIQNYFFYYLTPIILKSAFSFPVYALTLIHLVPLVQFLNEKHNYRWKLGY
ncbi:ECF transporter S component [Mesomycoplasma dispar]|uniref:ECF transporter S component n=2 Tax=Mesomycoplasma dispar TaxID=86660 RepID=A0ABN0EMC8_9BACT|nr:ECF transporter S component [Mesomycoplasma dispar]